MNPVLTRYHQPDNPDHDQDSHGNWATGDVTESEAFKSWFKGSKVVDEDGKPLVVYHGTSGSHDFETFGVTRDIGFHFGSVEQANRPRFGREGVFHRIIPVYLSIQNPLQMADLNTWEPNQIIHELYRIAATKDYPRVTKAAIDAIDDARSNASFLPKIAPRDRGVIVGDRPAELKAIREGIIRLGFDGVRYGNIHEAEGDTAWIAFKSSQIKSKFNRGTFNPKDPRISYENREGKPRAYLDKTRLSQYHG